MSAAAKGIFITGTVEDIEHKAGEGQYGAYDYHVVYVHTGRAVNEIRWDDNSEGPRPEIGSTVTVQVNAPKNMKGAFAGRHVVPPATGQRAA